MGKTFKDKAKWNRKQRTDDDQFVLPKKVILRQYEMQDEDDLYEDEDEDDVELD
jgi:hypothetical protein